MSNIAAVVRALAYLRPYDVAAAKRRVGGDRDGGYVVLDRPELRSAVLSYGVGNNFSFETELANGGARVVMFDHTITDPTGLHANLTFVPEGLGVEKNAAQSLDTLAAHVERYFAKCGSLLLKIDIDGGEYDVFSALDEGVLARFSQITGEFHHMNRLGDAGFRAKFTQALEKISKHFFIAHVHSNNSDSHLPTFVEGLPVSATLELTFVRRDLEDALPSRTIYPTALDRPCVGDRDRLMYFFPFCPDGVDLEAYAEAAARTVPDGVKTSKYKIIKVPPKLVDRLRGWLRGRK